MGGERLSGDDVAGRERSTRFLGAVPEYAEVTLKHVHRISPLWLLSLAFVVYGCASKPVEMIDKTEKAMQEAKAEHAEFFASDDWKAAEQAWDQASKLLDQEKWGDASTALLRASSRYAKARDLAKDKRGAFLKEVQDLQKTIDIRYKELKDKVAAGSAKLSATNRKAIEESCKEIEENTAKIPTQLDQGQFNDAKYLAGTTLRKVWEVGQDLNGYLGIKKAS
jgi:hypothetical protein